MNHVIIVIRIGEEKQEDRFYVVRKCAYIHGNNSLNFSLYRQIGLYKRVFIITLDMTKF